MDTVDSIYTLLPLPCIFPQSDYQLRLSSCFLLRLNARPSSAASKIRHCVYYEGTTHKLKPSLSATRAPLASRSQYVTV